MNYPDIECPEMGILHYDQTNDWYKGQLNFQNSEVTIYFSMDEERRLESAIKRFTNFVGKLEHHVQRAKEYAVESLLAIKNETWLEENKEPLTPQQWQEQMTIEFISIDSGGDISFYYPDSDLVAGHFLVTMDSDNNFINADIPS